MNNPFIISSCKTYTTYSEFFIVSQNIIAFPHRRWLAAYVPTHHIRRHVLTSSNCDRYMRSAKCTSTDRVIKCDDRPIPISGRSIGASLIVTVTRLLQHTNFPWESPCALVNKLTDRPTGLNSLCATFHREGHAFKICSSKVKTMKYCKNENFSQYLIKMVC